MLNFKAYFIFALVLGHCAGSAALDDVKGISITPDNAASYDIHVSVQRLDSSCPGALFVDVIAPTSFRGQHIKETLLHIRESNEYVGRFWLGAGSEINFCLSSELLHNTKLDLIYTSDTDDNLVIERLHEFPR